MMYQLSMTNREARVLSVIHEGMTVYDWNDKTVGVVNYIQFPSESDGDALYHNVSRADAPNHAHDEMRVQLLRAGFIQVESGLFTPMSYITPLQIHEVFENNVKLNVARTALIGF